jgi:putative AlgH/UPF0301 family transcriptional regulator
MAQFFSWCVIIVFCCLVGESAVRAFLCTLPRFGQNRRTRQSMAHTGLWAHLDNGNGFAPDFIPTSIVATPYTGTGCVLLSQPTESVQSLMRTAILIFSDSIKYGTQGVILDQMTAFRMGDSLKVAGPFDGNPLFMGGLTGSDTAIMLHGRRLDGAKAIGHGLYVGGMAHATQLIDALAASPREFKFVFNYMYWRPGVLREELTAGRWDVCLLPPAIALEQTQQLLWQQCRHALSKTTDHCDLDH